MKQQITYDGQNGEEIAELLRKSGKTDVSAHSVKGGRIVFWSDQNLIYMRKGETIEVNV